MQLLHHVVEIEAGGLLPLREFLERHQELAHVVLGGNHQEHVVEQPVVVGVRGDVRPLVGVRPQVEHLRHPERGERLGPDLQRPPDPLFHEHQLPIVEPQAGDLLVVVAVDERLARALVCLAGQVRNEVVPVEVNLVRHVAKLCTP